MRAAYQMEHWLVLGADALLALLVGSAVSQRGLRPATARSSMQLHGGEVGVISIAAVRTCCGQRFSAPG